MKYQEFKNSINKAFFRKFELSLLGIKISDSQVNLWQKRGYIKRLKSGLYVFPDLTKNLDISDFNTMSFLMYEPSYISLESALRHYGLIPEVVQSITGITTKTTRNFKNVYGNFLYRHIKPDLFWGYTVVKSKFGKYLLAEPEKAVLDYIYLNKSDLKDIGSIEELRINTDEFKKIIKIKKLKEYLKLFNSKHMNETINLLLQNVNA